MDRNIANKINKAVEGMNDLVRLLTSNAPKKTKDMDFGEALRAMKDGELVSMWHRDSIYVYLIPRTDNRKAELRVRTINGDFAAWIPNHEELINGVWRIVQQTRSENDDC